ncbi:MAG: class I SAM-dependent methyltransferase [Myxococcota bacterium]
MSERDWDRSSVGWDQREGARAYAAAAFDSLDRLCRRLGVALRGARILDFGCGTGLLSERLAAVAAQVIALDRSPGMIAVLRDKVARLGLANVHPVQAEASPALWASDPLFAAPFDLVVCSSVCAFVDDYPGTAAILSGRIRPGGLFVQWDWELDPAEESPVGLSRAAMRAALGQAGLTVVHLEVGFSITAEGDTMAPLMGAGQVPAAVPPATEPD